MKALLFILLFPVFSTKAQAPFEAKIREAVQQLKCIEPTDADPVTLNAQLVTERDSVAIIVKIQIAPGWHIYDYVPATLPYIAMDPVLQLPGNVRAVGSWQKTKSSASVMDPGVLMYEQEAVLIQKAVKLPAAKAGGSIHTGLYYQTCNLNQCLQPVEKTFDLKY